MEDLPGGLVTFAFTDIEGSTRLHQALGELYPEVLREHDLLLTAIFEAAGGRLVTHLGDGLFVAFPSAVDAVVACVDAQSALHSRRWPEAAAVRVRMGLHCGHAVPVAGNYVSLAVHQASRVAAAAHGGQVLLSNACRRELGDVATVDLHRLGEYRLKDFDLVETLWQATAPGAAEVFPAPRVPPAAGHNLRVGRTSFVGRDDEIRELRHALGVHPLVTVLGPGGVGKSRLATRVAAEVVDGFANGVRAVALVAAHDADGVALAVAAALGVPAGPDPARAIVDWLAGRTLLVLLDNCEHVVAEVAELVDEVLDACPGVRILATSREPLRLSGEHRWRVAPLRVPPLNTPVAGLLDYDSVQLFLQRADSIHAGFSADAAQVAEAAAICRLLDGLPLALELAAARAGALTLPELARRLRNSESLGGAASHVSMAHHRTLHSVVQWSVQLLSEDQREALFALSFLPAGFSVDTGAQVVQTAGVAGDAADHVRDLWEVSLLQRGADGRFHMLETIRQYCHAIIEPGRLINVRDATVTWALASTAAASAIHEAGDLDVWNGIVQLEHDNWISCLDFAVGHGSFERALTLLGNTFNHFSVNGHYREGMGFLEAVLGRLPDGHAARGSLLSDLGGLAWQAGDVSLAATSLDAALPMLRGAGDPDKLMAALSRRAVALTDAGRYEASDVLITEALTLATEAGDVRATGRALINLGVNAHHRQDYRAAIELNAAAAEQFTQAHWWDRVGRAENNIAEACEALGDIDEAVEHFERARRLAEQAKDPFVLSVSAAHLARLAVGREDPAAAVRLAAQALDAALELGRSDLIDGARQLLDELDAGSGGARRR